MPWNQETRYDCKVCHKPREPQERLTARGKHLECGEARQRANATQLRLKAGPYYQRYRLALLAALGGAPLDEHPESR